MGSRLFITYSLVLATGLMSACATTTQPTDDRNGRAIVDVASGELLSHAQAIRSLRRVRHIYVGEHHTSTPHHAVQLEVARSLHDAGVEIGIGIEWLSADHQPSLDAWVAGTVSESAFTAQVDWKSNWGHTFEAYAAILRFARDRNIPIWGLNASPGLARAVGRMGPERLSDDLRAKLPPLTTANDAHRAFFKSMMAAAHHGHSPHGKPGAHHAPKIDPRANHRTPRRHWLDRYYLAQLVRDEWMSINLAKQLKKPANTHRVAVVFAGLGHVDFAYGIPARAQKLLDASFRIVLPVANGTLGEHAKSLGESSYPSKRADLLWEAPGPTLQASASSRLAL